VTWVNIRRNATLGAHSTAGTIDATTSFFSSLHHVFSRVSLEATWVLAWKEAGVNLYGNSMHRETALWSSERQHDKARQVRESRAEGGCAD